MRRLALDITSAFSTPDQSRGILHIQTLAFSSDGRYLAAGSFDGKVRVWDLSSGPFARVVGAHGNTVEALRFSLDGRSLISAGRDGVIRSWDVARGQELAKLEHPNQLTRDFLSLDLNPTGAYLVSGGLDGQLRFWNVSSGERMASLVGHFGWAHGAFSPMGDRVASWGYDGTVRMWGVSTGAEIWRAKLTPEPTIRSPRESVSTAAFTPDGRYLATVGISRTTITYLDASSGQVAREINVSSSVWQLGFTGDGRHLVTRGARVALHDAASGAVLQLVDVIEPSAFALADNGSVAIGDGRGSVYVLARVP